MPSTSGLIRIWRLERGPWLLLGDERFQNVTALQDIRRPVYICMLPLQHSKSLQPRLLGFFSFEKKKKEEFLIITKPTQGEKNNVLRERRMKVRDNWKMPVRTWGLFPWQHWTALPSYHEKKKNQCFKTLGPSLDAVRPHHRARSLLFSLQQKGHARKWF